MRSGYSDTINHALAFAAKYYTQPGRNGAGLSYRTHPSHLAVILARYDCDDPTIVSGILHPVLAATPRDDQVLIRHKIADKFGSVVITTLADACEPRADHRGGVRPWGAWKMEYLGQLAAACARALDVCVASEIHLCGSLVADVRRLGPEYLRSISEANADELQWWHGLLLEALQARTSWDRREMLIELRGLVATLRRALGPRP